MNKKKGFPKDFWLVVIGQIISLFGNSIMRFALPIHLLNVTGSSVILGVVSGCAFLPLAIMAPVGGIIADRVNKRNIMVFLDFFTSGLTLCFLMLYGKAGITGLVLVTLFLLYGISGAYQPSVQASIPVLVNTEKVMPANAIINMISSLSGLLGPALGGIAYSIWGIKAVLSIAAVCFFLSAVMEIFIRMPFVPRERKASILIETKKDLQKSICYIRRERPEIGRLTICCAGVNLVMSALMIIGLPVIVMQTLDFPPAQASRLYGYMQAIMAVGGLLGGMSAGIFCRRLKINASWILLGAAALCLFPMGFALMGNLPPYAAYAILAVCGCVVMALASVYTIQIMSHIQVTVPQELVGKVIAWVIAVATCAQPLGQVVYGFLFESFAGRLYLIFFIAAAITVLLAVYNRRVVKDVKEYGECIA